MTPRLEEQTPRERAYRATFLLAQAQVMIHAPEAFAEWRLAARTDVLFRELLEMWLEWFTELCAQEKP